MDIDKYESITNEICTQGYDNWEFYRNIHAQQKALEYFNDFKHANKESIEITYQSNQSKEVETYTLLKVTHILYSCNLLMISSVKKRGDFIHVRLEFYRRLKE